MSDSLITKKAIALGLKELTKTKNFDKITVKDITEECGLNRQTFYYHFQDKYVLLDWIFYNETISIIMENLTLENWNDKVMTMLTKMKSEEYFYRNTLKLTADNGFKEYLFKIATELFRDTIAKIGTIQEFEEDRKKFITEFYAFGIVGVIIAWAQNGMKESPEYIAMQLNNVSNGTQKFIIENYKKKQ